MKTVEITAGFTGYPNGKDKRHFAKGETPELSDVFADLIVGKGLARENPATTAPARPAPKQRD